MVSEGTIQPASERAVRYKWVKVEKGIRYREHPERKHGQRFDRYYVLRYTLDGKMRQEPLGWSSEGMTLDKARIELGRVREAIRNGEQVRSLQEKRVFAEEVRKKAESDRIQAKRDTVTFSEFWESEYLPAAEITKRPATIHTEKNIYSKWISPALGDIPLKEINSIKVEALTLHAKKSGMSAATIRYILAIISQVWNKAVTRNIIHGDSPTKTVKKPRHDNRRMRFLSANEANILLSALKERSTDIYDEAILSLFCGLRAGEIHSLTWGDIDCENGIIFIRDPKSKKNRHAYITQEVRDMLDRRNKGQPKGAFVFPAENGKKRVFVSDTFIRTVNEIGLNNSGDFSEDEAGNKIPVLITDARHKVVFHTLRHTFASWLVQNGVPLYTVAELMGHSSLEMTKRYSHLDKNSLHRAALSLQGKLDCKPASILQFKEKSFLDITKVRN